MGDIEVTPPLDTKVTGMASTKPYVHTDIEFLGGSSDRSMLTRYVDQVTFRL